MSELAGRGTVLARAQETGTAIDPAAAARVIDRVKALEHRGYHFEAADGSFDLLLRRETGEYQPLFRLESWRVIAEKRADGKVETEATIKLWMDGERYVHTAEGNGPVHALDQALRGAIGERHPHLREIKLVDYKVRILDSFKATGAVTRVLLDASDGTDTWGAIGVHENVIEASWDALVDSLEAGLLPGRVNHARHAVTPGARAGVVPEVIPLAQPVLGEAEEAAVLEVLRSGSLSLGPRCPPSRRPSPSGSARACTPAPSRAAPPACTSPSARSAWSGRRGRHLARSPSSRAPTRCSTRARVPSSRTSTRSRLNLDPEAAAAAIGHGRRAAARAHLRLPGRPAALEASACRSSRTPARRSARSTPTASRSGGRGHPASFGFYANKQLTTGEGGMVVCSDPAHKVRIDSERNQGRAPDMGWLDHDRLGFNYRLTDVACAIGLAQLDRLDGMLADRARVAAAYRAALAPLAAERGLGLPCEDHGGDRRGWFVWVVQLPHGVDRDATMLALRDLGVQSKPYLPAIHLFSFYRERFGHRPGEFPICEDIAARSLALPFFPAMAEGQVERVAGALERILGAVEARG
jgi:perosamine synthetase